MLISLICINLCRFWTKNLFDSQHPTIFQLKTFQPNHRTHDSPAIIQQSLLVMKIYTEKLSKLEKFEIRRPNHQNPVATPSLHFSFRLSPHRSFAAPLILRRRCRFVFETVTSRPVFIFLFAKRWHRRVNSSVLSSEVILEKQNSHAIQSPR